MTPIQYAKKQIVDGRFASMGILEVAGGYYLCDGDWNILSGSKNYTSKDAAIKDRSKILDKAMKVV